MRYNKNRLKKWTTIVVLTSFLSPLLLASDNERLISKFWKKDVTNNCSETYMFSSTSQTFVYATTNGKIIMGQYQVKREKGDRFKLTLNISADNGFPQCSSSPYNVSNQTVSFTVIVNKDQKVLQVLNSNNGKVNDEYQNTEYVSEVADKLYINAMGQILLSKISQQKQPQQYQTQNSGANMSNDQLIDYYMKQNDRRRDQRNEAQRQEQIQNSYLQERYKNERIQNDYVKESYRNDRIQEDYLQQSYIDDEINSNYYDD